MRNANKAVREKEAQSARVAVKPEKKTGCQAKRNGGEEGNAEGPKLSDETVGIDVGDRFSQFCRLDLAGEILEEARLQIFGFSGTGYALIFGIFDFRGRATLSLFF